MQYRDKKQAKEDIFDIHALARLYFPIISQTTSQTGD